MFDFPHRYNPATKSVAFYFDYETGDQLVPNPLMMTWSQHLREGHTPCGKELEGVDFVFATEEAAQYNRSALDFVKIRTCVGDLDEYEPLEGEGTSFSVREDFGIE